MNCASVATQSKAPASSANDVYLLTLQFDSETFQWLQALRALHFPPLLNLVPAHLTLLHRMSRPQVDQLTQAWRQFERLSAPILRFTGVQSLGRGTALIVQSPSLQELRSKVMQAMAGSFSRQDQQPYKAHVTVQNKVSASAAKALFETLSATFVARQGAARGLMIWRYLGGPWSLTNILKWDS